MERVVEDNPGARAWIGTSGFNYRHWANGVFYPERLAQKRWLEYYAERFPAVELNVSFYRLPSAEAFRGWYRRTPADFRFALKGQKYITHLKRLRDCAEATALFFERAALLGEKLAVALWQLPPGWEAEPDTLREFADLLPAWCRQVFEFRHRSWLCPDVVSVLRDRRMALCVADRPFGMEPVLTADFGYVRRHGPGGRYGFGYTEAQLAEDAKMIVGWLRAGIDVYCFFNNDAHGYAVKNARELMGMIGV